MPWSVPDDWNTIVVPGATDMNRNIRDNMNYLFSQRPSPGLVRTGSFDYTTTSTSWVAVDTTNLVLTATINSGRFRVFCNGTWIGSASTVNLYVDIGIDGTIIRGSSANYGSASQLSGSVGTGRWPFSFIATFTGISVGAHSFYLAWRVDSGTGTMLNTNVPISMQGWEF